MQHTRTKMCKGVSDNGVPCTRSGSEILARGYCTNCYRVLRDHCMANGSWPAKRGEEIAKLPMKPWVYEGDEAALAAMFDTPEQETPKEK